MKAITTARLRKLGACYDVVSNLERALGRRIALTAANLRKAREVHPGAGWWLAQRVLPVSVRTRLDKAKPIPCVQGDNPRCTTCAKWAAADRALLRAARG